jgi:hypothetical protein
MENRMVNRMKRRDFAARRILCQTAAKEPYIGYLRVDLSKRLLGYRTIS